MELKNKIKIYDMIALMVSIPTTYVLDRGNLAKDQKDLLTLLMCASLTAIPALHYGYLQNNNVKVKSIKKDFTVIKSKGNLKNI